MNLKERISIIDSLRGLALFGILIVHCAGQFFGVLPQEKRELLNHSSFDTFFSYSITIIAGGKFFLIFALLFGVSFWIQYKRATEKKKNFNLYYIRRMFILILFGIVHYSFFQGDILVIYGLISIFLIFLKDISQKHLFYLAIFFLSGFPRLIYFIFHWGFGDINNLATSLNPESLFHENYIAATSYSLLDLMRTNLKNWLHMVSIFQMGFVGRGYQVLGCFLLGIIVMQKEFFNLDKKQSYFSSKLFKYSIITAPITLALSGYFFSLNSSIDFSRFSAILMVMFYDYFNTAFAILIVLTFIEFSKKTRLSVFYEFLKWPGRMSLTIYIIQSLFFTWFYFSWGIGMFNSHGATISVLIGSLFFIGQSIFALYWFKYFKQGPLETIWKKLSS